MSRYSWHTEAVHSVHARCNLSGVTAHMTHLIGLRSEGGQYPANVSAACSYSFNTRRQNSAV
jgi:hypothetical protein